MRRELDGARQALGEREEELEKTRREHHTTELEARRLASALEYAQRELHASRALEGGEARRAREELAQLGEELEAAGGEVRRLRGEVERGLKAGAEAVVRAEVEAAKRMEEVRRREELEREQEECHWRLAELQQVEFEQEEEEEEEEVFVLMV